MILYDQRVIAYEIVKRIGISEKRTNLSAVFERCKENPDFFMDHIIALVKNIRQPLKMKLKNRRSSWCKPVICIKNWKSTASVKVKKFEIRIVRRLTLWINFKIK